MLTHSLQIPCITVRFVTAHLDKHGCIVVRYTWSDCYAVVQHEYSRVISFLKLEEHRNRKLDPLPENDTSETYYRSLDQALHAVL